MPAPPSDDVLCTAVLRSVEHGQYPDLDTVASAKLGGGALPAVLQGLNKAREQVRDDIRATSREVAPDVDGWIQQAKQLQADIEESRATAQAIVKQAQEADELRNQRNDSSRKVELLRGEVDFNTKLESMLEDMRDLARELGTAQNALKQGKLDDGLRQLQHTEAALATFDQIRTAAPVEILQQRTDKLRRDLIEQVQLEWDEAIAFDNTASKLTIRGEQASAGKSSLSMNALVDLSTSLELLEDNLLRFCRDLNEVILIPCLVPGPDNTTARMKFGERMVAIESCKAEAKQHREMDDILELASCLGKWMPFATGKISKALMPTITSQLLLHRLNPLVPISVDRIHRYESELSHVKGFTEKLASLGWTGTTELTEWANEAPRIWLAKRREATLEGIRTLLSRGLSERKTVEHVETQLVSRGDVIPPNDASDDWNDWKEDETETLGSKETAEPEEVVDEGAWGWDDDGQANVDESSTKTATTHAHEEQGEDEGAAWGWDEQAEPNLSSSPRKPAAINGHASAPKERELTLRESYTTTGVPDELIGMIVQLAHDAERLREPEFSNAPIADAVVGLFSIPTLALAGFRALAPNYYQNLAAGNMLLYNDSVCLAELLKTFAEKQGQTDAASQQPEKSWPSTRMKLDGEIAALESFSRRAYGKEMDAQRTVLRDLLDGAQGFANCAEAPFANECESAVSMTADRIRAVAGEWSSILSRSALLQSLGSLLSTVIGKMIVDIEDMSDIGEDESKQLRRFCTELATVSELFRQGDSSGDVTGVYTPDWFKFQYLSEIMESSLADIKYLWNEGELKLEFDAEELVDLVEALFAESDLRRRAIGDIRGR